MHWPPPKILSPTPGKRGAGYSSRACDGSIEKLTGIASIKATDLAVNGVTSLLSRCVASISHFPFGALALIEPPCSVDRGPAIAGLLGGSRRNQRTTVDRRENSDGSRSAMTPSSAT